MTEKIKETRNCRSQVKADTESRAVEGYAILFDTPSDGMDFTETIAKGALDGVVEKSDVFALINHSNSRGILARSEYGKGSLKLTVDDKGLRYNFDAPNTALGDEILENLRRNEIHESSFCFTVADEEWKKTGEGDNWSRTVNKIDELFDVSPVYNAAYSSTSVNLRGKEAAEAELERLNEEKRKAGEREKNKPDEAYYNSIEKSINI